MDIEKLLAEIEAIAVELDGKEIAGEQWNYNDAEGSHVELAAVGDEDGTELARRLRAVADSLRQVVGSREATHG
jgi:hypothetical protein